jgi:hypothetical protein
MDTGRNKLHNALFNIQQRGQGPWTSSGGVYTADRWSLYVASDTTNAQITAINDTGRSQIGDEEAVSQLFLSVTGNAAAGAQSVLSQGLERIRRLSGKTVTVSFWAAASAALKVGVSLDQAFGTGGSPSPTVFGNGQSVTISTTWARYTFTFAIPSATGMTFGTNGDDRTWLNIWMSSGSTNAARSGNVGVQTGSFYFWGVQLEVGSQATPLEKLGPRDDLANCQRFYTILNNMMISSYNTAGATVYCTFPLPVTMRAAPALTFSGPTTSNASNMVQGITFVTSIMVNTTVGIAANFFSQATIAASADL